MQMSIRGSFATFMGAALIAGGSLCVACVTEDADPSDGAGGTSNGGASGDTGGAETAGGATGTAATACPPIEAALLTDFTMEDGGDGVQATFGSAPETFAGGTFQYPDTIVSDVTDNNWHVSGTVSDYAGFSFYFQDDCSPVDASAYQGFRFTISGTLPEGRTLQMWVGTSPNTVSYDWLVAHDATEVKLSSGTCVPATDNQYDGTCENGLATVAVEDTAQTIELTWAQFTGGKPESSIDPSEITGFGFRLSWSGATDSSYDIDITLDDFGFIE
jgi:hypothetical protein